MLMFVCGCVCVEDGLPTVVFVGGLSVCLSDGTTFPRGRFATV